LRTLLYNARLVAAMDDRKKEILDGYVLVQDERIDVVGEGTLPGTLKIDRTIDMRGRVVLPGFVNTHHHLPQTLTRNVPRVQEAPLFKWLQDLYEVWRGTDAEAVDAGVRVGLGELLLTGCTTTSDHLYLFPRARSG